MDLNLSQAEKAMLAFCGVFVFIFSMVMYYSMIIQPNQTASSSETPRAEYSASREGQLVTDHLAPAANQNVSNVVSGNR